MAEEPATEEAAVAAGEHEEQVTKRERPADKSARAGSRRQEEGRTHGDGPTTVRRSELVAVASYDGLVELNRAGMDATLKASEAMLNATSSLAEELTSFARQRLRTDVETGGALLNSSNDWGQAVNLLGEFANDAARDYLEEMTRIAQLSAQTTRDVWTPLQEFSTRLARGDVARPS
jgi:hypothetical protein